MAEDLLDKVFSFISRDNNGDPDNKLLMRQIMREITQNKYAKFYRAKTEEFDPTLAGFFYDIYKIVFPVRSFVQDPENLSRIKHITVEAFMDRPALETSRRLRPEAIEERAKTTAPKELAKQLKEELYTLSHNFDPKRLNAADQCYNLILTFIQFTGFNYYQLLKRFDPNLIEGDFSTPPKFVPVKAFPLIQDLEEFQAVAYPLDSVDDWKNVFTILKIAKMEFIPPNEWSNVVQAVKDLKKSNILDLMAQYTTKNPIWFVRPKVPNERIVESWLEVKAGEIQRIINRIVNTQRNAQIELLAKNIFGSADIVRLVYYNDKGGEVYQKKNLETFGYARGLNYLVAFIDDYLSKEIQELCDILLIRGQWTSKTEAREMSDGFYTVLELAPEIMALDETMSDKGDNGARLKGALVRIDRDKSQIRYINSIISTVNEEAQELINSAAQNLIIVGKHMKNLLEDYQKSPHELIMNWKELGAVSRLPIGQRIADAYKQINYFIQLMQFFSRPPEV
ncbi:MAG: DUF5312 family protein [Spirochaetaceae bacterium]|jgi:hypothetical protein|nr:DUF5312 family protein [Spirochaetaceae bacterium]